MEIFVHTALGALVGEWSAGASKGRSAALAGACLALVPDAVNGFAALVGTAHLAGLSDSLGFWFLLGILFLRLLGRRSGKSGPAVQPWLRLVVWVAATRLLLACCGTDGAALFAPFVNLRITFRVIAAFDLFLLLPLLLILPGLFLGPRLRRRFALAGLFMSGGYLAICLFCKILAAETAEQVLLHKDIEYFRFQTIPGVGGCLIWYLTAETREDYCCAYFTPLAAAEDVVIYRRPKQHELLADLYQKPDLLRSLRRMDRYYVVRSDAGSFRICDTRSGLRWGAGGPLPDFHRSWRVASDTAERVRLTEAMSRNGGPLVWQQALSLWHWWSSQSL